MKANSLFDQIYEFLKENYRTLENTGYFGKTQNIFGPHPSYLYDTPHGYWGGRPEDPLPDNHSKRFSEQVANMIAGARHVVDITNLGLPSGAFKQAIIDGAITSFRNNNGKAVIIRILCGRSGLLPDDTKGFLQDIQRAVSNIPVKIYAGAQRVDNLAIPIGWNHSKYVAVDGKTVLFGGHNFNSEPYFGKNPIFDLSVKLDGPIAQKAHLFSVALWEYVNKYVLRVGYTTYADALVDGKIEKRLIPLDMPPVAEAVSGSAENSVPAIHIAQPGLGILNDPGQRYPNPSLSATYHAINSAKKLICISQQDMGGKTCYLTAPEGTIGETSGKVPYIAIEDPALFSIDPHKKFYSHFDINLFNNLATVLIGNKDIKIKIVLTNPKATSEDGTPYSYGASVACVYRAFGWFLIKRYNQTRASAISIISSKLHIRTLGFRGRTTWLVPPKKIIGNHAKFWAVDDEVCYIGSHNMYPSTMTFEGVMVRTAHLQEWGAVIGNNTVVKGIVGDYFDNLFNNSLDSKFDEKFLSGL